MIQPRLFLCSGATLSAGAPQLKGRKVVELDALGHDPNVTIKITDVARVFTRNPPARMVDLLEVASYVFTGDTGTRRGKAWLNGSEEPWSRDLHFVIPVRDVGFWREPDVILALTKALGFLSNDRYTFEFTPLTADRQLEGYLELGTEDRPFERADRVIMFSGGLDSLAGSVETASEERTPLVLVSHRSVGQINVRQKNLFRELKATFPKAPMLHVPVWINKANALGHEPTQRTRSFLFTALGICVGAMVDANGVRFFENGVVSLNLPVADEVLRARASRTTHPHALRLLAEFASLVMRRPYVVENPYLTKTKADIVSTIATHGAGHLIGHTVSCAHTMFMPKAQQHCGACSQCIDRRIGVLAAGCEALDPGTDYVSDVFTGPRKEGYERAMAVHYARHAMEIRLMSGLAFATTFNLELTRAVRGAQSVSDAMTCLYELHQRHANGVHAVLSAQLGNHAADIADGKLDPSSMLALIADRQHKTPVWGAYAGRLSRLLQDGIPPACRTHQPKDEPHLQEIAEGILRGYDDDLDREFPFMRWSGSTTKGDFSKQLLSLWVEMKYVRKKRDVREITEDISSDITKYGDNGIRVLFVVYDPKHLIDNDAMFSKPIVARPTMRVSFVR